MENDEKMKSFKDALDALIGANAHARNKGDDFKSWSKDNFNCDARISFVKEQRQITNRVSEQFRYFAPIVIFVCVPEVKRDTLVKYILERGYTQLENVAVIGVNTSADGEKTYAFERLLCYKHTSFTEWASNYFPTVEEAKLPLVESQASGTFSGNKKIITIDNRENGGINKIFYGAPGCGKSHVIKAMLEEAGVAKENKIRTTFHPEYSNSDFIGQILPTVELAEDGTEKVRYIFNPGPFSIALNTAYNTGDMVYLVVEEINRGNAAAIFGDMFQLLDRVKDSDSDVFGESEYFVCNPNMQKYLKENVLASDALAKLEEGVYIPSNLTILATMNTSDQNVFTLDTAFKRRWSFEQISNDIKNDTDHSYKGWFIPGTEVTWEQFLVAINNKILEYKIHNQTNEDKRLGKYFVTKDCLTEEPAEIADVQDVAKNFAYKVLEYVWNDVCKIGREDWFDTESYRTLEDLINAFINPTTAGPLSVFQNLSFES